MFSFTHLAIIFIIALLVFGPEKLPEIARQVGKVLGDFRRASTDFRSVIEKEFAEIERQTREKEEQARRKALEASSAPPEGAGNASGGHTGPPLPSGGGATAPADVTDGGQAGMPRQGGEAVPPQQAPPGSVANTTAKDSGHISQENRSSHDVHSA